MADLIRTAAQQRTGKRIFLADFRKKLYEKMDFLQMERDWAEREVNVGFSGGEKKKAEVFTEATNGETSDEILAQMRGEEPISEDLEEEINRYIGYPQEVDEDISTTMIRKAARHFAQWQKQKDIRIFKELAELANHQDGCYALENIQMRLNDLLN